MTMMKESTFLLPGETVKRVHFLLSSLALLSRPPVHERSVRLVLRNVPDFPFAAGELVVTSHRLLLVADACRVPISVPLAALSSVDVEQGRENSLTLDVLSRDLQSCLVVFAAGSPGGRMALDLIKVSVPTRFPCVCPRNNGTLSSKGPPQLFPPVSLRLCRQCGAASCRIWRL